MLLFGVCFILYFLKLSIISETYQVASIRKDGFDINFLEL